jgi:hypothetical protein
VHTRTLAVQAKASSELTLVFSHVYEWKTPHLLQTAGCRTAADEETLPSLRLGARVVGHLIDTYTPFVRERSVVSGVRRVVREVRQDSSGCKRRTCDSRHRGETPFVGWRKDDVARRQ